MTDNTKICVQCGAEFVASADQCSDCGGRLVSAQAKDVPFEPLDDSQELVLIRVDSRSWVNDLARVLDERGVQSAIRLHESPTACGGKGFKWMLLVRQADVEKAAQIDREYWLQHAPQESDVEVEASMADVGKCPACGGEIGEGAEECPSCGLWLGE